MREEEMHVKPIPVACFRAPDGSRHTVAVMPVNDGWRIVDQNRGEPTVVDTLTNRDDGPEQAEAVAHDYAKWATLPTWARQ